MDALDYLDKLKLILSKPKEIVIILIFFTSLALLIFTNNTISTKSSNLPCTEIYCNFPKLDNNETLDFSFTINKLKVNCVDPGRPQTLRIIGLCDGKILIATYLTEQMKGFAPGVKIPSSEDSRWVIEYTRNQVRYIVNNSLAYTHYTPFPIQTEKISLDHKSFENVADHFKIELKKKEPKIPKPLEIFFCLCLIGVIHLKIYRIVKNDVINYRIRIPQAYLYAISIIWMGVLYQILSIPRTNLFASSKTPLPTIFFSFSDYWQIFDSSKFTKPYQSFPINYPPFALSSLKIIGQFGEQFGFLLLLYCGILAIYLCEKRIELVRNRLGNTILIPLVFFPITFAIGRANLDLFATLLLLFCVIQWKNNRRKSSVVLLALASSLKIWPSAFLVLYLKNKQFKEFFSSLALIFIFQAVALRTLGYNFDEREYFSIARNILVISNVGTRLEAFNNTSLIVLLKSFALLVMMIAKGSLSAEDVTTINLLPWQWLQVILLIGVFIMLTIWKKVDELRLIGILCFAVVLLPNPAYLYRSCIFIVLFYLLSKMKVDLDLSSKTHSQGRVLSHVVGMIFIASSPGTSIFFTNQEIPIGSIQGPIFTLISLVVFLRMKSAALTSAVKRV